MAPNLAASQHTLIRDMILDGSPTNADIAKVARCSPRTVRSLRENVRLFGSTRAPHNGHGGRPLSITPPMLDALLEHLLEKPDQYLNEMVVFLWDEFEVLVTTSTISRTLKSIRWSKKAARRVAAAGTPTCETCTSTIYPPSSPTTSSMLTNPAVTKEWGIGEQSGLWV